MLRENFRDLCWVSSFVWRRRRFSACFSSRDVGGVWRTPQGALGSSRRRNSRPKCQTLRTRRIPRRRPTPRPNRRRAPFPLRFRSSDVQPPSSYYGISSRSSSSVRVCWSWPWNHTKHEVKLPTAYTETLTRSLAEFLDFGPFTQNSLTGGHRWRKLSHFHYH